MMEVIKQGMMQETVQGITQYIMKDIMQFIVNMQVMFCISRYNSAQICIHIVKLEFYRCIEFIV